MQNTQDQRFLWWENLTPLLMEQFWNLFIYKSKSYLHDLSTCTGKAQQLRKHYNTIFLSSPNPGWVLNKCLWFCQQSRLCSHRNRVGPEDILWYQPWPGHLKPSNHHLTLFLISSLWNYTHPTCFSWLRNCLQESEHLPVKKLVK